MRDKYIQTAESVTEGHPDKLCDTIADAVLDACLHHDSHARVACEVMATAGKIIVAGEITAKELPDIPAIVCRTVRETGYNSSYEVEVITHDQSGDIAGAVSNEYTLGAGDQGIVYGYACNETRPVSADACCPGEPADTAAHHWPQDRNHPQPGTGRQSPGVRGIRGRRT